MSKKPNAKKLLETVTRALRVLKKRNAKSKPDADSNRSNSDRYRPIELAIEKAFLMAFKRNKLNPKDPEDRELMLELLTWVVYGGKLPGRPKKWTTEMRDFLLGEVSKERSKKPGLSEDAYCKEVSKRLALPGSPRTLRRQLQEAKRSAR